MNPSESSSCWDPRCPSMNLEKVRISIGMIHFIHGSVYIVNPHCTLTARQLSHLSSCMPFASRALVPAYKGSRPCTQRSSSHSDAFCVRIPPLRLTSCFHYFNLTWISTMWNLPQILGKCDTFQDFKFRIVDHITFHTSLIRGLWCDPWERDLIGSRLTVTDLSSSIILSSKLEILR